MLGPDQVQRRVGGTMQPPVKPEDEGVRVNTLRALDILDTPPEERFDRLTRLARRVFNVPIALVSLVDTERLWVKSRMGEAMTETAREISFCGHAILGNELFLIPDTLTDVRFFDNPLVQDNPHIRFYAGYPLAVPNGSKLGTLCLFDMQPRELDVEERALLRDLAQIAEQELAAVQLATLDEMTRLSNRRGFEALAGHALNMARRQHRPASLLFFDLNDFKKINDTFGHAEGDRALIAFAELLRTALRESDVIGRLGGDEFVALLSDADATHTAEIIGRMQDALNELNREQARGYDIRFSVGITEYDAARHASFEALLAEADVAMYANKEQIKARPAQR